ncbi:caspase domain-containing protein [Xylaria telfairii]|nr:caspase domain-containing protein [Xylaria telfairii]
MQHFKWKHPSPQVLMMEFKEKLGSILRWIRRRVTRSPSGRLKHMDDESPAQKKIHGCALLIGCDHGELHGTKNDVIEMEGILRGLGTHDFKFFKLTGCNSTAKEIRATWKKLIEFTKEDDAVVIYYSGHGGRTENNNNPRKEGEPNQFQYLVPHDFDENDSPEQWKGILDIEISRWLFDITKKTDNVTYILDCCYSSGLGKGPERARAEQSIPKCKNTSLLSDDFSEVWKQAQERCMEGMPAGGDVQDVPFAKADYQNPKVVRIAASAAESTAWQCYKDGKWTAAMTHSLGGVFGVLGEKRSWLNLMAAVGESMKLDFESNPQQPRSAGADDRIPFLLKLDATSELWADIQANGGILIQGGLSIGMKAQDIYEILPIPRTKDQIVDESFQAEIEDVYGFSATAVQVRNGIKDPKNRPAQVAFAKLVKRKQPRPVLVLGDIDIDSVAAVWLRESKLFEVTRDPGVNTSDSRAVIELKQEGSTIILQGRDYSDDTSPTPTCVPLSSCAIAEISKERMDSLFERAEIFARACDVLSLTQGKDEEVLNLDPGLEIFRRGRVCPILATDPKKVCNYHQGKS